MEVFVGNLNADVTEKELQKFFKGYDKKASFTINKFICNDGPIYYGIVDFEADKLALKAIRKLNHKSLNGHPTILREFHYRAGNNDRRALNWRNVIWEKLERRFTERRLKQKKVALSEPSYSGYDNLASKGF